MERPTQALRKEVAQWRGLRTDLSIQSLELDFDLLSLGVGPVCKNTDDGLLISACVCFYEQDGRIILLLRSY